MYTEAEIDTSKPRFHGGMGNSDILKYLESRIDDMKQMIGAKSSNNTEDNNIRNSDLNPLHDKRFNNQYYDTGKHERKAVSEESIDYSRNIKNNFKKSNPKTIRSSRPYGTSQTLNKNISKVKRNSIQSNVSPTEIISISRDISPRCSLGSVSHKSLSSPDSNQHPIRFNNEKNETYTQSETEKAIEDAITAIYNNDNDINKQTSDTRYCTSSSVSSKLNISKYGRNSAPAKSLVLSDQSPIQATTTRNTIIRRRSSDDISVNEMKTHIEPVARKSIIIGEVINMKQITDNRQRRNSSLQNNDSMNDEYDNENTYEDDEIEDNEYYNDSQNKSYDSSEYHNNLTQININHTSDSLDHFTKSNENTRKNYNNNYDYNNDNNNKEYLQPNKFNIIPNNCITNNPQSKDKQTNKLICYSESDTPLQDTLSDMIGRTQRKSITKIETVDLGTSNRNTKNQMSFALTSFSVPPAPSWEKKRASVIPVRDCGVISLETDHRIISGSKPMCSYSNISRAENNNKSPSRRITRVASSIISPGAETRKANTIQPAEFVTAGASSSSSSTTSIAGGAGNVPTKLKATHELLRWSGASDSHAMQDMLDTVQHAVGGGGNNRSKTCSVQPSLSVSSSQADSPTTFTRSSGASKSSNIISSATNTTAAVSSVPSSQTTNSNLMSQYYGTGIHKKVVAIEAVSCLHKNIQLKRRRW